MLTFKVICIKFLCVFCRIVNADFHYNTLWHIIVHK